MSRKEDRRNKVTVGKSLYRQILAHSLPEAGRNITFSTKYGKQHLGTYQNSKYLAYVPGVNRLIRFGRHEITKWEYVELVTKEPEDNPVPDEIN